MAKVKFNNGDPLALAVFQAFSLAKLRNLRLFSQKLKFWESLHSIIFCPLCLSSIYHTL
jgi:hypothetical protein